MTEVDEGGSGSTSAERSPQDRGAFSRIFGLQLAALNARERLAALGIGAFALLFTAGLIGLALLAYYGFFVVKSRQGGLSVIFLGLATVIAGFLLGFLFGLPRSRPVPNAIASTSSRQRFSSNTNLEDVSDWLTKILVGIGLVQIQQLYSWATELVDGVVRDLGDDGSSTLVASALAYFLCLGFLSGYLWARINFWQIITITDEMLE